MKSPHSRRAGILGFATLVISIAIVLLFSSAAQSGAISQCAPTPNYVYDDKSTRTPTPDAAIPVTARAEIPVSSTPLFISKNTFDLAPDVPADDKYAIIIFRCDGTFDTYLAAVGQSTEAVKLGEGDIIWDVEPSRHIVGNQIVDATFTPMPLGTVIAPGSTDSPVGYPADNKNKVSSIAA